MIRQLHLISPQYLESQTHRVDYPAVQTKYMYCVSLCLVRNT